MKSGIVILSELRGPARDHVREIQCRFDPRLAAGPPPHVTISGSSGMGPIIRSTSAAELRAVLEPIARETEPMTLTFLPPEKFMQKHVVVLPLDPHGPLRALHDRIRRSGLRFETERYTFTPHVTLSFFRELEPSEVAALLRVRVTEAFTLDRIAVRRNVSMTASTPVLELPLGRRP